MGPKRLRFHPKVAAVDIPKLDPSVRQRIRRAIESKLADRPEDHAKPLAYTLAGLWCLRVGDWRVVFAVRGEDVWVLRIGHRREVYEALENREPDE